MYVLKLNKDVLINIKGFVYYTNAEIKKFKMYHYFFNQHKLNKEIKLWGFLFKDDIKIYDCLDSDDIINLSLLF